MTVVLIINAINNINVHIETMLLRKVYICRKGGKKSTNYTYIYIFFVKSVKIFFLLHLLKLILNIRDLQRFSMSATSTLSLNRFQFSVLCFSFFFIFNFFGSLLLELLSLSLLARQVEKQK